MPTYVYGCDACGHQFEKFQKFSDEPVRECPQCGKIVRRIFQPAGIVFKGSGWHITDYKRSSNGSSNGSNGTSEANGEAKKETATPEAKSETKSSTTTATESSAT